MWIYDNCEEFILKRQIPQEDHAQILCCAELCLFASLQATRSLESDTQHRR